MIWEQYIGGFKSYLLLERNYSPNTLVSYMFDIQKFFGFINAEHPSITPKTATRKHIEGFIKFVNRDIGSDEESMILKASSQNRLLSSLRTFFKFLLIEDVIDVDPTSFVKSVKLPQKLPIVLSNEEIMTLISACDKSTYHGFRNYVMIEVLYATGLRISELINLRKGDIFVKQKFIRVVGKGNKERIVPIGTTALRQLNIFIRKWRTGIEIDSQNEHYVFLNRRGRKITRQLAFSVLKDLALQAGIKKAVHPHIFRHSFATELISRGANIMAVKDMMGHSNVCSTEIYTNFDTSTLRETLMLYHPLYSEVKKR